MPERDIESLGVMGGWLAAAGNSSAVVVVVAVAAAVAPLKVCVFWLTVSSPLGLRTEISARYCLEKTRTGAAHLFCFHRNL